MSRHPLIGHAVRVTPPDQRFTYPIFGVGPGPGFEVSAELYTVGQPPPPPFDGIVTDVSPAGLLVMRLDDGTVKTWGAEYVTFSDPERAARVLRLHAADNDFRAAGCTVLPEYTPPRWVPAKDVAVGTPYLAAAYPFGSVMTRVDWGTPLSAKDKRDFAAERLLLLVGEWPPLPKEGV